MKEGGRGTERGLLSSERRSQSKARGETGRERIQAPSGTEQRPDLQSHTPEVRSRVTPALARQPLHATSLDLRDPTRETALTSHPPRIHGEDQARGRQERPLSRPIHVWVRGDALYHCSACLCPQCGLSPGLPSKRCPGSQAQAGATPAESSLTAPPPSIPVSPPSGRRGGRFSGSRTSGHTCGTGAAPDAEPLTWATPRTLHTRGPSFPAGLGSYSSILTAPFS